MFWKSEPKISTDEAKIDELLSRSVVEVIPSRDALKKVLTSGKRLRIKLGIDPTSPNIHIGRSVALLKLKDFQELGHQLVSIVGDFTGVIGDTSDKDAERPMLTSDVIESNKAKYFEQAGKVINAKAAELRYNSEWLSKLGYKEIGEQADQFSVSDFTARELIKKRLDEGKRVSLRETLYPLMQGYDSVAIKSDVEIGGTDQRFNMLAGRTLQKYYGQPEQFVLILGPLLPGTDGRKMSSSWGNTINLEEEPSEMFGKLMSIPDNLTREYLVHTTRLPLETVDTIAAGHPKNAKLALATELVRMYHGEAKARQAKENFEKTFSKGEVPTDIPTIELKGRSLVDALVGAQIVSSKSDYRRLEEQKAVTVLSEDESGTTYRIGKHRFVKVKK